MIFLIVMSINLFGDGYTENLNKTTFTLSGTNITNDHNLQPNYVYKLRAYNNILQDYSKPSDISKLNENKGFAIWIDKNNIHF